MLYTASGRTDILSEECSEQLSQIWTIFENYCKAVMNGSITIGDLETVLDEDMVYQKRFVELYLIQFNAGKVTDDQRKERDVQQLLDIRQQELRRMETEIEQNENLRRFCDNIGSGNIVYVFKSPNIVLTHFKVNFVLDWNLD